MAGLAYDPAAGALEVKWLLPDGMSLPRDFGFVPSTRGDDGDALDILALNDETTPAGALLMIRLIGVIEADQTEDGRTVRNDRLLAVAEISHLFVRVSRVEDLPDDVMKNLPPSG